MKNESLEISGKEVETGKKRVSIVMRTTLAEFLPKKEQFIIDLADILGASPDDFTEIEVKELPQIPEHQTEN